MKLHEMHDALDGEAWIKESNFYTSTLHPRIVEVDGYFNLLHETDNVASSFLFTDEVKNTVRKLPVKFGKVMLFNVDFSALESIEGLPMNASTIFMSFTKITSFIGISDVIKSLNTLVVKETPITSGGLGLLLIDNLKTVKTSGAAEEPFEIIHKYLGRPDDIFECQSELIEAGYEAYAEL